MTKRPTVGAREHGDADERRHREAALDRTIEESFPASDPPSTDPNPNAPDDDVEQVAPGDGTTRADR